MSELLISQTYVYPYCSEVIDTLINTPQGNHQTVEDCSVCCCPIELCIELDGLDRKVKLTARSDSE